MLFRIHWDAFARYVDEVWLIVSKDMFAANDAAASGPTEADVEAAEAVFQHDVAA